jgi:hypothetical protein
MTEERNDRGGARERAPFIAGSKDRDLRAMGGVGKLSGGCVALKAIVAGR